ncbi:MAG: hypothetical protein CMF62_04360 [Magnetococcales bacterium]|nr:hypothetical protein [Magnetococcales bacterium]|tara:strand:+ start:1332 stop:1712 length:381 start_codon:yes stop_codon:yes gene_type:complete
MVEYICKKCNYETIYKTHYKRHCLSKKHIKNNNYKNKLTYYKCSQCKYKTTRSDHYDNHIKRHNNVCINTNSGISSNDIINILKVQTKLIEKLINKSNTNNITNNQTIYNYIVNNIKLQNTNLENK